MSNEDSDVKAEIEKLVKMQSAKILQNYPKVRAAYQNPYGLPELDTLRHEITEDDKRKLHECREVFRNAYGHADKEKTFGDTQAAAFALRVDGNAIINDSEGDLRLADFLPAQGLFQVRLAEQSATQYFLLIDSLARQIIRKLFPKACQAG
jgi:hypothetical protein